MQAVREAGAEERGLARTGRSGYGDEVVLPEPGGQFFDFGFPAEVECGVLLAEEGEATVRAEGCGGLWPGFGFAANGGREAGDGVGAEIDPRAEAEEAQRRVVFEVGEEDRDDVLVEVESKLEFLRLPAAEAVRAHEHGDGRGPGYGFFEFGDPGAAGRQVTGVHADAEVGGAQGGFRGLDLGAVTPVIAEENVEGGSR